MFEGVEEYQSLQGRASFTIGESLALTKLMKNSFVKIVVYCWQLNVEFKTFSLYLLINIFVI